MKIRNVCIGTVVGGLVLAGGVRACAAKTGRYTIENRIESIVAKKPNLKGVAKSSGGKVGSGSKNMGSFVVQSVSPIWKLPVS